MSENLSNMFAEAIANLNDGPSGTDQHWARRAASNFICMNDDAILAALRAQEARDDWASDAPATGMLGELAGQLETTLDDYFVRNQKWDSTWERFILLFYRNRDVLLSAIRDYRKPDPRDAELSALRVAVATAKRALDGAHLFVEEELERRLEGGLEGNEPYIAEAATLSATIHIANVALAAIDAAGKGEVG
jgi:hypothetical protein